jgi:hypothetical protein
LNEVAMQKCFELRVAVKIVLEAALWTRDIKQARPISDSQGRRAQRAGACDLLVEGNTPAKLQNLLPLFAAARR